ncbi:MAG TPA: 8-amino-7-oxononanoate synthase [Erwinia persicina]|uniref:8-amino-7-oxononanoate synthase n=1 Tax=Erwinia persicina TaxID=55211 RepID=UPI000E97C5C1|nr:8-amino-7-oxononanoate synthase [Erwinia persicina]MBC3945417.1 8-amino-7-oxononanoate synthase [Erwinia persicina]MCQ4093095.1 8-amino-7-oxononanoate synthase [Erwinia persicina]MCQ4100298.1 8-amino-7-oxononanoate synthase [Erwinia persicina]HBH65514.1 8-amino-7-oxononanoate synthase [Erwinia persicina]HBH68383.1 8-amino-7-oxononanoate synthase [Erwinia persicina]
MSWSQRLTQALTARHQRGQYRQRHASQQGDARRLQVAGVDYLNFSANDYLGLSHDPGIVSAWQQGAERYGVGAGGSTHVTGYRVPQAALEEELADWLGYDRGLLFMSGFSANQAVIAAMLAKNDRIFADKLCHASLLEAASLSPATLRRFAHNQPGALATLLAGDTPGETLVVTEGIFSMDGDRAPLAALHALSQRSGSWLLVDDAHGVGVCGEQGRGSGWQQGVKAELLIVTFGKAFGVSGAALLCNDDTAEYLLQFARHLIYSTAMPPAQVCAIHAALRAVRQGDDLRRTLADNIRYFRQHAGGVSWSLSASDSAIQPLIVGEEQAALRLSQQLRERGCWVNAIRPPTVPPGTSRLRITLSAAHSRDDIDQLLEALYAADRR